MESEALVKSVYRMTLAWGDQLQETWRAQVNLAQGIQEAWGDEEHQSKSLVDSYHYIINNAMQDKMKSHVSLAVTIETHNIVSQCSWRMYKIM